MDELAVGVTIFQRADRLAGLLESIPEDTIISHVYIADNGEISEEKRDVYSEDYPFQTTVLDLEYDSGLGYCRQQVVQRATEEYLLVVDNDVEIPHNVDQLLEILLERPDIGGVGGVLIENNRIRSDCYDLFDCDPVLLKSITAPKDVQEVAGFPFVEFDQIQNVTLYRRECLEDYCWDPNYVIGWEHTDFFLGHKQRTDWSFGICPEVMFRHFPGGDESYLSKRRSKERIQNSKRYFLDKWGYDQVVNGQVTWLETNGGLPTTTAIIEESVKIVLLRFPSQTVGPIMDVRDLIRSVRGKPPF